MKYRILNICSSIFFISALMGMENVIDKNSITIRTQDNQEYKVNRGAIKIFQTLDKKMNDEDFKNDNQGKIVLSEIDSQKWETIYNLFINEKSEKKMIGKIREDLQKLDLKTLLSIIQAIDYLDPFMFIDGVIIESIREKIELLGTKVLEINFKAYDIPEKFHSYIVEALLQSKNIVKRPLYFYKTTLHNECDIAWSHDGNRLAINKQSGVEIIEADKSITKVNTNDYYYVEAIAWSNNGRLAIGGDHNLEIVETNGTITKIDLQGYDPLWSFRWSDDGSIALLSEHKVRIIKADGSVSNPNTSEIGDVINIAWLHDGSLALGTREKMGIIKPDGTIITLNIPILKNIRHIKWSYYGDLVVINSDRLVFMKSDKTVIEIPLSEDFTKNLDYIEWLFNGNLLIVSSNTIHILQTDGTITQVNTPLGFKSSVWGIAQPYKDYLALHDYNNVYIIEKNEIITKINTQEQGRIYNIAWSDDGYLGISGDNSLQIVQADGTLKHKVNTKELGYIYSIEWSSQGNAGLMGMYGIAIYNKNIPQEQHNFTLNQALLVMKLDQEEIPRYLNDAEYAEYQKLPTFIQNRYQAELLSMPLD